MKRREFLAATCAAGVAPLCSSAVADEPNAPAKKEYYELRRYRIESEAKQKAADDFLREAAVPAWNRLGIGPVGVFQFLEEECLDLYVLLPHKSAESVFTANDRLMSDSEFLRLGAVFLDAPFADPAYSRIESSLMVAFDAVPKLEVPSTAKSRVFQLRTYESHNAKKALKKIEMFNSGGEVEIFRGTGLLPVFFGQTLVGTKLPNLTYMVGFDNKEAQETAWEKFMSDPGWLRLKADPAYKDTVCNITNILLRPAASSQI